MARSKRKFMVTPKRKLTANRMSMVNKVIRKKMKYCRIIGCRCSRKIKTMKKWGEEQESLEDEEQRKQQEEDKPQDGTSGGGVLIWRPP
jgi:hypothetical protein